MARFDGLRRRVGGAWESLSHGDPDPKSIDERPSRFTRSAGVGVHQLKEREMDENWDFFKDVPIIREPIRAFATEVVSPGVSVEAGSQEAIDKLEDWLSNSAILHGEVDRPFRLFAKAVIIQREVRGTVFVEKVMTEGGEGLYGFKGLPAHSVRQYTRPNQSVLLAPDDDPSRFEAKGFKEGSIHRTDDGDVAAYVQFDDKLNGFSERSPIPFARDEIIKLTRDADFGEVSGSGRVEAVDDRINSLLAKLDANDEAIQSKAWKFWLFLMGTGEDGPWDPDDIDDFMANHDEEDFSPGMKQAVQGDIEIETISGEVAEELDTFLDFDVNWIISAMPLPKYALGGFEENVNQFVSRSQETRIENQIQEARRELEDEFTPVLKQKAEEFGFEAEGVKMVIEGDDPKTDFTRPKASSEQDGDESRDPRDENSIWNHTDPIEDLSDPRLVSTTEPERDLKRVSQRVMEAARDSALNRIEDEYTLLASESDRRRNVGRRFGQITESELSKAIRRVRPARESRGPLRDVVQKTLDTLSVFPPDMDRNFRFEDRQTVRTFSEDFRRSVEDATEEMLSDIRVQARVSFENGEEPEKFIERVGDRYSDQKLSNTGQLLARMNAVHTAESIRLRELEKHDDVAGVKVINSCSETTTRLCRDLAGCAGGEPAIAFFEDGPVGDQLQDEVSDELLFEGFDPLPETPPYHWGCSSGLVPVLRDETEEQS